MVRNFNRHQNAPPKYQGLGYRVKAEHINELQIALEDDDARLNQKADAATVSALSDVVANILPPPIPAPAVPGLFAHWDAFDLNVVQDTRISSWTDKVTGTVQMTQANVDQRPAMSRGGINGRPALRFVATRNDMLTAAGLAPGSNTATVFVVATKPTSPSGVNRYMFGTSGHAKSLFIDSTDNVAVQSSSFFNAPAIANMPQVVTGVFNDTASAIRIDGVETAGSVGANTILPATFVIGQRPAATAGQGHNGWIGEVMYYNRALSSGECAEVERYLSSKWGIPVGTQAVWYVDPVRGDNTLTGRSIDAPVASLARAVAGARSRKVSDATIRVNAPEDAPIRGEVIAKGDGNTLRIESAVPGRAWHMYGSQRIASGWAHAGGGIYTRAYTPAQGDTVHAMITTLLDSNGNSLVLRNRNTTTPTTPSVMQYGYSGGMYYLNLGGIDPNLHIIEILSLQQLVTAHSGSRVYLRDAGFVGSQVAHAVAGGTAGPGGYIEVIDCSGMFSHVDGFCTRADTGGFRGVRCVATLAGNDGFNHTANSGVTSLMELIDCEGAWNNDEGVSPHGDTRLILRGGRYHHNGSGGLTSVGTTHVQLVDTEFDHNGLIDGAEFGVNIDQQSTLVSTDLYSHDNIKGGIRVATTATWIDNGGTRSGVEHGNGGPDAS